VHKYIYNDIALEACTSVTVMVIVMMVMLAMLMMKMRMLVMMRMLGAQIYNEFGLAAKSHYIYTQSLRA
jgi:hypothetical protein